MVTKPTYSSKPMISNYDKAFGQMFLDFTNKKLKKLICPAMGCMRDQISPMHFVKQRVNFHHKTGAVVNIMLHDERATRKLRNGLKHVDFMNLLRTSIAEGLGLRGSCSPPCKPDGPELTFSTPSSVQVVAPLALPHITASSSLPLFLHRLLRTQYRHLDRDLHFRLPGCRHHLLQCSAHCYVHHFTVL